jgi:hypothetical protein
MVENIKTLPSFHHALIQVRWFWAKKDIEKVLVGMRVDRNLRRYVFL